MKREQHEATRETLQHEKSAIVKVHQIAQMDNGPSVDGTLYTGQKYLLQIAYLMITIPY